MNMLKELRARMLRMLPHLGVECIEGIKMLALMANDEGDEELLTACITRLDEIWLDHAAARHFYTVLEQTAPPTKH